MGGGDFSGGFKHVKLGFCCKFAMITLFVFCYEISSFSGVRGGRFSGGLNSCFCCKCPKITLLYFLINLVHSAGGGDISGGFKYGFFCNFTFTISHQCNITDVKTTDKFYCQKAFAAS